MKLIIVLQEVLGIIQLQVKVHTSKLSMAFLERSRDLSLVKLPRELASDPIFS